MLNEGNEVILSINECYEYSKIKSISSVAMASLVLLFSAVMFSEDDYCCIYTIFEESDYDLTNMKREEKGATPSAYYTGAHGIFNFDQPWEWEVAI
jgi:hypothetical protein